MDYRMWARAQVSLRAQVNYNISLGPCALLLGPSKPKATIQVPGYIMPSSHKNGILPPFPNFLADLPII